MKCPRCERPCEPGQRFCNGCGLSLAEITGATNDDHATADGAGPPTETITAEPLDDTDPDGAAATSGEHQAQPGDERNDGDAGGHAGRDDHTQLISTGDDTRWSDPDWAPTGSQPTAPLIVAADDIDAPSDPPATEPQRPIAPTEVVPAAGRPQVATTTAMPTTDAPMSVNTTPATHSARHTATPAGFGFRFNIVTLLGVVGAALALGSMFTTIVSISSNVALAPDPNMPPYFTVGEVYFGDLSSSLPIAGLIAACCMAAGGVAAGFGWRWGGGLAGGGGLGFAGLAALTIGLAQLPLDAARQYAQIPSDTAFTLGLTRDVGYWLLIVTAAFGVVLYFASLNESLNDRRRDLNPWIAALGALAAVVCAAGPLLPVNLAQFSDNWFLIEGPGEAPAMLVVGRLVQIVLLALVGVIGFLLVRPYGLGLAVGGSLPALWLGVSVLLDVGDSPVGPGWRNPGAEVMELHGVTIIGLASLAAMLIIALAAAYNQTADY